MILCEWDAPEGNPGMLRTPVCFRILSSSLTSVSIFSVWCYSSVSISVDLSTWVHLYFNPIYLLDTTVHCTLNWWCILKYCFWLCVLYRSRNLIASIGWNDKFWERMLYHEILHTTLHGHLITRSCQNLSKCSARDWERSGLLEENPQSGCSDICASLNGPL